MKKTLLALIVASLVISFNAKAQSSPVLGAAEKEMNRFMDELKDREVPPYFIAYEIIDKTETRIVSSFGEIIKDSKDRNRTLDVDLRVGDYNFDNSHIIRGKSFGFFSMGSGPIYLPLEDKEEALREIIWRETEKEYKNAIERYGKALANTAVKAAEEDTSADFSKEEPSEYLGEEIKFTIQEKAWRDKLNEVSKIFSEYDWIYSGMTTFTCDTKTKYFVNTEGSKIKMSNSFARIYLSIRTKADDGMNLPLYKSYFTFDPKDLPDVHSLKKTAKRLINILDSLRNAPKMEETYSGPALLSGEASGVFFHEIFGHRVEGHRLKDPNNAQTFKGSIGEEVLPKFMDVIFDPTKKHIDGVDLSGYYKYDDEGVKAQKVTVVKDGIFKNFLMSRTPIEDFDNSNGHGRKEAGYKAVSRQSNLIVKTEETHSIKDLREKLRDKCEEEGKEYGLFFDVVQGGFTFTGRAIPNSFNVTPLLVYKVYADGRPDEMLRGVDLIGTPLTTFSNIVAAGDDIGIFNGICGAESGGVPVSSVSPTILVSKIEVQKKPKSQEKSPILPAPKTKLQK